LHSETVSNSSTRASPFPSAATAPRECLAAHARRSLSSRSLEAPCSYARNVFLRAHRAHPKTSEVCTGRLGAARCERGRGDPRFTTRFSLRRPGRSSARGVICLERARTRPPLTSLSPPPSRSRGARVSSSPCVGPEAAKTGSAGPRERPALRRSGTSSIGSCSRAVRSRRSTSEPA